jgi:RNA polymerase sporulation-specific sigma factor
LAKNQDYMNLKDDDLIYLSKNGDGKAFEVLINKHYKFINLKANSFFIVGTDREDLLQEALIGFYKAVRDYNFEIRNSFLAFADLCIRRQIITAIKTALRKKHELHLTSISLDKPIDNNNTSNLLDVIPDENIMGPEMSIMHKEDLDSFRKYTSNVLSELESKAFTMYYNGHSYRDIATMLGKNYKSIDASINRAKIKLRKHVLENNKYST